jgi:hypothetical protein
MRKRIRITSPDNNAACHVIEYLGGGNLKHKYGRPANYPLDNKQTLRSLHARCLWILDTPTHRTLFTRTSRESLRPMYAIWYKHLNQQAKCIRTYNLPDIILHPSHLNKETQGGGAPAPNAPQMCFLWSYTILKPYMLFSSHTASEPLVQDSQGTCHIKAAEAVEHNSSYKNSEDLEGVLTIPIKKNLCYQCWCGRIITILCAVSE